MGTWPVRVLQGADLPRFGWMESPAWCTCCDSASNPYCHVLELLGQLFGRDATRTLAQEGVAARLIEVVDGQLQPSSAVIAQKRAARKVAANTTSQKQM